MTKEAIERIRRKYSQVDSLKVKDVCRIMNVSAKTVYRLIRDGYLTGYKLPGNQKAHRFEKENVFALMEKHLAH